MMFAFSFCLDFYALLCKSLDSQAKLLYSNQNNILVFVIAISYARIQIIFIHPFINTSFSLSSSDSEYLSTL